MMMMMMVMMVVITAEFVICINECHCIAVNADTDGVILQFQWFWLNKLQNTRRFLWRHPNRFVLISSLLCKKLVVVAVSLHINCIKSNQINS